MSTPAGRDAWDDGAGYEAYVGRWSRLVAREFVAWLGLPPRAAWLDVGCGAGALSEAILTTAAPARVVGCDQSGEFVAHAARRITDARAHFAVAALPELAGLPAAQFDAAVSGLVLNFLPDPLAAARVLRSRLHPGGTLAAYVWDYREGMQLIRAFWDAAIELDAAVRARDEAVRFPLCDPAALQRLFTDAGMRDVVVRAIEVPTVFRDFSDFWSPFLSGQGPAPGYAMSLSEDQRTQLRESLRRRLPADRDGTIRLIARAWAVRGTAEAVASPR